MPPRLSRDFTGHTLIEVLVALVIVTVVLGVSAPRLVAPSNVERTSEPGRVQAFVFRARSVAATTGTTVTVSWDGRAGVLRSSVGDSLAIAGRLQPLAVSDVESIQATATRYQSVRITFGPTGRTQGGGFVVLADGQGAWRLVLDPWTGASRVAY